MYLFIYVALLRPLKHGQQKLHQVHTNRV